MSVKSAYLYIFFVLHALVLSAAPISHRDSIRLFYSLCSKIEDAKYIRTHTADSLADELKNLARRLGDTPEFFSRAVFHHIAIDYAMKHQHHDYSDSISMLIARCDSTRFPYESALLCYSMFMTKTLSGDYAVACHYGFQALKHAEESGCPDLLAEINNTLAQFFRTIGEYNTSLEYGRKALEYYLRTRNTWKIQKVRLSICTSLFLSGEKKEAIHMLEESLPVIKKLDDPYILTAAYLNLGAYYGCDSRKNKSYEYYRKALEVSGRLDNDYVAISIWHNIGAYYLRVQNPDSSYKYLKQAENYYIAHNINERLPGTYAGLALSFSQKNRYDSAYYYQARYDSLRNRFLSNERLSLVNKTEAKYILSDYQNKLKITRDEYIINQKQTAIIIISAVGIILTILLSLLVVIKQKKTALQQKELKELENRRLSEKLQQEKDLSQLQKQEFTQTIDSSNRKISTTLLFVSNKNLVMNKILQLTNNCNGQKEDFEKYKKEVVTLIRDNLNMEEAWNECKLHFEKVHPLFFSKLKQLSGELTENDLRLCAYIKIGMRTKEIAQILSVSPESIKMSRYRLKKKLHVPANISIDDFLPGL